VATSSFGPDFLVAEALKLPVAQRVEMLHRLWESLPEDSGDIFVSDELIQELNRRIAYEDAHPDEGFSWEEVKNGVPRSK
jgi:putative addiction module component (TIGR02574 family)